MRLTTRVGLLGGASALVLTGASFADNPATGQDQDARIAELEAQVARLTGDNWLTDQRAEEIRELVQDVLADADTRASLLQSGMSGGYDNGFVLGSADGAFTMRINGHMQTRFVSNSLDDDTNTVDESRRGFENTRTRLIFSGDVGGDGWGYYMDAGFARGEGSFDLRDAWISYDAGNGWTVSMGQFRRPFSREFLVDSMNQLAVERSNTDYFFSGGRTQGIRTAYSTDTWRFTFSTNNGDNTENQSWEDYDTEYSLGGRIEFLLSGNWSQFDDFTSPMGSETGFLLGFAVRSEKQEYGSTGLEAVDNERNITGFTVDGSYEADGWNAYAAFYYIDADLDSEPLGLVVQGGMYFNETTEGYLRWEYIDFDTDGLDDNSMLTVGVNLYYTSNVTMSADFGYGFDTVSFSNQITGWRNDVGSEDGQYVLRAQLELTF